MHLSTVSVTKTLPLNKEDVNIDDNSTVDSTVGFSPLEWTEIISPICCGRALFWISHAHVALQISASPESYALQYINYP